MNPGERLPTRILWGFLLLVILGILAAIVIPKFSGRTEQAKEQARDFGAVAQHAT